MSAEVIAALAAVGVATVGAVGSIAAAYIARRAERHTRPIGNGFAGDVQRKLDRLHDLLTEHLADHAGHDLSVHVHTPSNPPPAGPPATWQGDDS